MQSDCQMDNQHYKNAALQPFMSTSNTQLSFKVNQLLVNFFFEKYA